MGGESSKDIENNNVRDIGNFMYYVYKNNRIHSRALSQNTQTKLKPIYQFPN